MLRRIGKFLNDGLDVIGRFLKDGPETDRYPVLTRAAAGLFGGLVMAEAGWLIGLTLVIGIIAAGGVKTDEHLGDYFIVLRGYLVVAGTAGLLGGVAVGFLYVRQSKRRNT